MQEKFILDVSERSIVVLNGKDGLDLLQRLSTNELAKLETGSTAQTILTNDRGKIVDVIVVLKRAHDDLLLVGNTQGGNPLQEWLEKYIIMEDATVQNITSLYAHFLLYGLGAGEHKGIVQSSELVSFSEQWGIEQIYHLLVPVADKAKVLEAFAKSGFQTSSSALYTNYRIEHRIPSYPNELSTTYNPMEAGLIELISFTKGCYIGQEVIARLDTYKKVQRKLVVLTADEPGAPEISSPFPIYDEKGEVGVVTSISTSVDGQQSHALGYVKTSVVENPISIFHFIDDHKTYFKIKS